MPSNPFAKVRVSGDWEDHSGYSLGGEDLPLGYGTVIPAIASGTLRIAGGSGEFAAGEIGSAGRRSVFTLDAPIYRHTPRSPKRMLGGYVEAEGPAVALVLQHQSKFGTPGHHDEGAAIGVSGASTVVGGIVKNFGGDTHLHWHLLDGQGRRLDPAKFLPTSSTPGKTTTASSGSTPIEEDDMSFAEQIPWRGGSVSAASLIIATALNAELAVAKADRIQATVDGLAVVQHGTVNAPDDVVQADTLVGVQQANARIDELTKLIEKNGVAPAVDPS